MKGEFKINNIEKIWNKPSNIKNGQVITASFCVSSQKFMFGKDLTGKDMWFDYVDIEEGWVEEYYED
ncbi:hypothetical protein VP14_088 [Vibrio phage VPMCC14]|nr:hypothetical protein VP14_088 [Vibrio phage VPMCC14]